VSPRKWDDPWENAFRQSTFRKKDGPLIKCPFRDCAYRQCWTLDQERDVFWRMYVPNGGRGSAQVQDKQSVHPPIIEFF